MNFQIIISINRALDLSERVVPFRDCGYRYEKEVSSSYAG